jgi:membrane protein DedA with SNARE-associated domain
MFAFITRTIRVGGYGGITLLMFIENVFPPIPSELIMPLAGFLTRRGDLLLLIVILAGTLGSVLGAIPLYYAGRSIGRDRLARWTQRHGKWLALSEDDLEKSEQWFARHGAKAVLFGRLIPAIRSLISIPAGVHRMDMTKFLALTALGSLAWTALLAGAGWMLGAQYNRVENFLAPVSNVVVAAVVIWYVIRVVQLHRAARSS